MIEKIFCELLCWLADSWEVIRDFLNSNFFTAAFGALGGAYFGQRIVERGGKRKDLLADLHNTNSAISLIYNICNTTLNLKKQHVKPVIDNFLNERARLLALQEEFKRNPPQHPTEVTFVADFRTLQIPVLPIALLQNQIFGKVSVGGRATILAATLAQELNALEDTIKSRNALVAQFHASSQRGITISPELYFGFPNNEGHVNQMYFDYIKALSFQTDSAIFFATQLCADLVTHGQSVKAELVKDFRVQGLKLSVPNFSEAQANGLMPDENLFKDWQTKIVS